MNSTPNSLAEVQKKYEEKVKSIMTQLTKLSTDDANLAKEAELKLEQEIISFEKLMDEESMNRINWAYKANLALVAKLRDLRYDFNQDKSSQNYENMLSSIANSLKNI
jgi:hypothetical protein